MKPKLKEIQDYLCQHGFSITKVSQKLKLDGEIQIRIKISDVGDIFIEETISKFDSNKERFLFNVAYKMGHEVGMQKGLKIGGDVRSQEIKNLLNI